MTSRFLSAPPSLVLPPQASHTLTDCNIKRQNMVSFPYHQLTKIHLTERALADLNRLNDPDAPNPMPSTLTERKTTAYDRNFDQLLFDKGYKSCWMERLPKAGNWKEIQAMLSNDPIASSEDDYDTFVELLNDSRNETKLRTNVLPLFLRRLRIPNEQDMLFNNLEPLNEGLADAKPDLYDGARPSTLDPEIRACLSKMIVPSKDTSAPILPNFFLEFKGPDGTPAVARRQILQDGSLGARAIKSLQEWRSVSDEGAHTISGTFHDGILDLYTTHCTMEEKNRPVYYTNIIFTRNMRQDPRSLGEG